MRSSDAKVPSVPSGATASAAPARGRPDGAKKGATSDKSAVLHSRKHDAEQTRLNILDVATEEFAAAGLAGARVDTIAANTRTTKRMIYYYFESKEKLYEAVLERVYSGMRTEELVQHPGDQEPLAAMIKLVETTFDYHEMHPNFVRLVTLENFHAGRHLKASPTFRGTNASIIALISQILRDGYAQGVFRDGVDPIDLHMLISSFSFHRIANRHTFGTVVGRDPLDPAHRISQRQMLVDAVLRFLEVSKH